MPRVGKIAHHQEVRFAGVPITLLTSIQSKTDHTLFSSLSSDIVVELSIPHSATNQSQERYGFSPQWRWHYRFSKANSETASLQITGYRHPGHRTVTPVGRSEPDCRHQPRFILIHPLNRHSEHCVCWDVAAPLAAVVLSFFSLQPFISPNKQHLSPSLPPQSHPLAMKRAMAATGY